MAREIDVLVIGGGPGGYPAAIRSAQLGKDVLLVEKENIGGECLNWGCIPSKALVSASGLYHKIAHEAKEMGIEVENATLDTKKLHSWKDGIQKKLVGGVKQLLKANKVDVIMGSARLVETQEVEITSGDEETQIVKAKDIIIATGAALRTFERRGSDRINILSVRDALKMEEIPDSLVVLGDGYVALELATIYSKFGSKVTLIGERKVLLQEIDPQLGRFLKRSMEKLGIDVVMGAVIQDMKTGENGKATVHVRFDGEIHKIEATQIVASDGKEASSDDIGLENLGIETDNHGFISINNKQQTNVPHYYAVGDCTGPPFLAHRATKQGVIAAEVIAGEESEADFRAMPGVVFTDPEIAYAGMTEEEAREEGYEVVTGRAPFSASGRAMTEAETDGFVKVVAEEGTGVILGVQIIGPDASDLISEVSLALEMGAVAEDLAFTVHPHPTLPEMIMEAVGSVRGEAIHVMNRKR
ncbi:MAG: dihydrolipoyl dehydrogenase [Candidatus Thorarchaeota archaeon]|nr:dihydrolipoyl dehydrogenase [Candidatus Thorarchaeota archaeon]